ncbi:MAG: OmpW family outer membrane protein [Planctomycetota bacterium]
MKRIWPGLGISLLVVCLLAVNQLSGAEDSTDEFLKKYALAESLELGIEFNSTKPTSDEFSKIQKYFFTLAHTINENSTLKLKIGMLTADYEDTKRNNIKAGTLKETPLSLSLIAGLSRHHSFKPYIGAGFSYLRYVNFDADQSIYNQFKARNTPGYHLLAGLKYISARNITFSLDVTAEWLEPFSLKDNLRVLPQRKVDLSNWSTGVNIALRF